jgi:beta-lactamase class A
MSGWMWAGNARRTVVIVAMLALAACSGAIPNGSARPQSAGNRPAVNRPVVQPQPQRGQAQPQRGQPQPQRAQQRATPAPAAPANRATPVTANRNDPGLNRPPPGLEPVINELWRTFPGRTGIAVHRIGSNWTVQRRGDEFFPQQSVSKLWVVMTLMDRIDRGQAALTDVVTIGPDDLTLFNQPLATRVRQEGAVRLTVAELIEDAITMSDNTANDALLRHAGGPDAVLDFFRRKSIAQIRFGPGERLLQSRIAGMTWQQRYSVGRTFQTERALIPAGIRRAALDRYLQDPEDGAHPSGIAQTLARLVRGDLLSQQSTRFVLDALMRTRSGPQRLRAGVPAGWTVAHKTGTGQEFEGRATGYNDIGIITAPDGTQYAVAVMLAHTTASVPQRMALMQGVSRAVAMNHGL